MKPKTILRAALPALAYAVAFCATEVWNTKDSSIWTDAEPTRSSTTLRGQNRSKPSLLRPVRCGAVAEAEAWDAAAGSVIPEAEVEPDAVEEGEPRAISR